MDSDDEARAPDTFAQHQSLEEFLFIDSDAVTRRIFQTVAALCDPLTQPEDSAAVPLSIDGLARVCIALSFKIYVRARTAPSVAAVRFAVSLRFFAILGSINHVLQADEELRLRHSGTDPADYDHTSKYWLPRGRMGDAASRAPLKLMYYMSCVLLMALHRLFLAEDGVSNAATNPYAAYFLRLWKAHTDIVNLALELDRIVEQSAWEAQRDDLETPEIVRMVVLGSSAVRAVLAYILNEQDAADVRAAGGRGAGAPSAHHDMCGETLLNFYDPLARAPGCGALVRDQTMRQTAQLVLDSFLTAQPSRPDRVADEWPVFREDEYRRAARARARHLGVALDLPVGVFYDDQIDDDVKYVFGYFDSDEDAPGSDGERVRDDSSVDSADIPGMAQRAKGDRMEFDDDGRDWRDCPRGQNVHFSERYVQLEADTMRLGDVRLSNHFFSSWFELRSALEFIELTSIEMVATFVEKIGQVTVDTVAKAIRDEAAGKVQQLNPDRIYKFLVSHAKDDHIAKAQDQLRLEGGHYITNFELILVKNPRSAVALLDELFMCRGLRRSLIWFLTHSVNPSIYLLNYIYELAGGRRGDNPDADHLFRFSRKGTIEISDVEEQMLLHEFFSAACKWLVDDVDAGVQSEANAKSLMSFVCLIIEQLLKDGKLKPQPHSLDDYSHELLALLFPWMGRIPLARELFFLLKQGDPAESPLDTDVDVDIVPVLAQLRPLSPADYNNAILDDPVRHAFSRFATRLVHHISHINNVHVPLDVPDPKTPPIADFSVFITHYNDFARNGVFAGQMNTLLGLLADAHDSDDDPDVDSEFNDSFLNGEVKFEGKKKKKKKKRGKKR